MLVDSDEIMSITQQSTHVAHDIVYDTTPSRISTHGGGPDDP
jgi:hypothetical protein